MFMIIFPMTVLIFIVNVGVNVIVEEDFPNLKKYKCAVNGFTALVSSILAFSVICYQDFTCYEKSSELVSYGYKRDYINGRCLLRTKDGILLTPETFKHHRSSK